MNEDILNHVTNLCRILAKNSKKKLTIFGKHFVTFGDNWNSSADRCKIFKTLPVCHYTIIAGYHYILLKICNHTRSNNCFCRFYKS